MNELAPLQPKNHTFNPMQYIFLLHHYMYKDVITIDSNQRIHKKKIILSQLINITLALSQNCAALRLMVHVNFCCRLFNKFYAYKYLKRT